MRAVDAVLVMVLIIVQASSLVAQKASDIMTPDFGTNVGSCAMCGMDVAEKMLTRVDLATGDTVIHACALGCAAAVLRQHSYNKILVCDYDSMRMVPAMEASFLFGSRVTPARSMLPELSFASRESALRFQQRHGGTLLQGKEAFEVAMKIRQERMSDRKKSRGS